MPKNFNSPESLRIQQAFLSNVDRLLDAKGMTRADLCRAIDMNQPTLSRYYNSTRQMDIDVFIKIANYFDKQIDDLLHEKPK
jgi:transcriptional regulator with XRE-family HTH domain